MDIEASELGEEQTDTEEDLDSASAEMENTARKRTFTEKGKLYEKKTIDDMFEVIKRLCENILSFVEKNAPFEVIRSKFSLWMDKYEHYLEQHQNFMARIREQEKEEYIYIYEDREAFLCDFKRTIEKYFSDSQSQTSSSHRGDRYTSRQGPASHHSDQRSTHSSRSSILSNISSKKLAEEQQRVELELKKEALKKKRLLELAKINIQMDEEELDLSTGIAVSDAKTNILNKYELLENVKSETQSIRSKISFKEQKQDKFAKVKLNPHAPHFEPKVEKVERSTNKGTTNIGTATLSSTYYKSPITEKKEYITTTTNRQDSGPTDQNNNSEAITAIVKNLRKPMPEIKRFSGDPLEFRKFVRQFTVKIVQNSDTEDEKMNYLEQFTFGEAHKVVSGFSHLSGEYAYQAAMEQLEERYGNSEVIANAFIKKALEWPTLKAGDSKGLDEFSLFLIECENAAHSINALRILEYSENIKRLMCKLPFHLHDRWRSVVLRIKTNKETVQFGNFVKFVKDEAKKVNDLTYGSTAVGTKVKTEPVKNENSRRNFRTGNNAFATDLNREVKKPQYTSECSYCKSKSHKLEQCNVFKKLPTPDKYNHMKSQALCFGCLKKGHMTRDCKYRLTCSICRKRHPSILHDESKSSNKENTEKHSVDEENPSACHIPEIEIVNQLGAGNKSHSSCAMAIIPVKVKLKNRSHAIETYAFFDTGSSISFCTEEIMHQLGGNGKKMEISLNTMGTPHRMSTYALNGLQVCDIDTNSVIDLPTVYTKDKMPVAKTHIPTNEEIVKWPHLNNIVLPDINGTIGLMIGNNVPDAYTPYDIATGPAGSPHATRSRLGWIVWNLIRKDSITETNAVVNRAQLTAIHENNKLDSLVRKSINLDFPELLIDDKKENSIEDNYFLKQVNESIEFEDGHYQVALPFRNKEVKFPNNVSQGLNRLKGLRNKMTKNQKFKDDYVSFMNNLFSKGFAEKVPITELNQEDGRVWYIPHHGIYHNKKPNKIRVVFDCSASYMGVSLNALLLQGPDLANNLIGVLLRFRTEKVALQGDIESMFYQVKVPLKDRNLLRFLWWPNGDMNSEPEVYRMTVHIFGATSSPSVCNFALRRTAQNYGNQFEPQVAETILNNIYVDDCLVSTESEEKAISLVDGVRSLCTKGGFNMTKWTSTSSTVIKSIPDKSRTKNTNQLDFENESSIERALGVSWYIDRDVFGFQINTNDHPHTKRGILSVVSSVYDPLGIASPFVLIGRSILQNLCKQQVDWDEEINETDEKKWISWLNQLNELHNVKIDRCYKPPNFENVMSTQIHCFSDASDIGYGMVFYLRLIDKTGRIHCSFVLRNHELRL